MTTNNLTTRTNGAQAQVQITIKEEFEAGLDLLASRSPIFDVLMATNGASPLSIKYETRDIDWETRVYLAASGMGFNFEQIPLAVSHPALRLATPNSPLIFRAVGLQPKGVLKMASMVRRDRTRLLTQAEMAVIEPEQVDNPRFYLQYHARQLDDLFAIGQGDRPVAFYGRRQFNEARGQFENYWVAMRPGLHGLEEWGNYEAAQDADREFRQSMHGFLSEIHLAGVGIRTYIPIRLSTNPVDAIRKADNRTNPLFLFPSILETIMKDKDVAQADYEAMLPAAQLRDRVEKGAIKDTRRQVPLTEQDEEWAPGTYDVVYGPGLRPTTLILTVGAPNVGFVLKALSRAQAAGATISKVG